MDQKLKFSWSLQLLAVIVALFMAGASCDREEEMIAPEDALSTVEGTTYSSLSSSSLTAIMPLCPRLGVATTFRGSAENVYKYIASVDSYVIKEEVIDGATSWSFNYTFSSVGSDRNFHINGFDVNGNVVASASANVSVVGDAAITVAAPSNPQVNTPVTISGTCANVHKYIASADGYVLKEEVVSGQTAWSFAYTFNTGGKRNLVINAFDCNGYNVGSATRTFTISSGTPANTELQQMVMRRCAGLAPKNRPYFFDGVGDCWGYVRQVWNAILHDGQEHAEDYGPGYNKRRWILLGSKYIPVNDAPSSNWRKVTNWDDVPVGMPISSAQGHAWGANWHGAIYAGKENGVHMMWDSSGPRWGRNGAYKRPISASPKIRNGYYYIPLYNRLKGI